MTSRTAPRGAGRALLALLLPLLTAFGAVLVTAGPAAAEDGYRYWNYSHLDGQEWAFAQTGPGDHTPKDGDVEGWRYGTSTVSQGIFPRADLDEVTFEAVCGDTEAANGEKRVAVLVDFGTEADAGGAEVPEPRAECAVAPAKANGQQVLESVVDVRQQDSMLCALDGYPAQGCGEPVKNAKVSAEQETVAFAMPASADAEEAETTPAAADSEDDGGLPWTLIAVLVVVLVLGALTLALSRRNRDA